jgi:predicted aspartyl protease
MWLIPLIDAIGDMIVLGTAALLTLVFLGPVMPPMPPDQHPTKTISTEKVDTIIDDGGVNFRVASKITTTNRCLTRAYINGRGPFVFMVDSGAPDVWFHVRDLPALGIDRSSLHFTHFGEREGNVAWVKLADVRVGDFVAHNINAAISDSFDHRLLGMSVLKQGHMEVQGDVCSLTFPRNAVPHAPVND